MAKKRRTKPDSPSDPTVSDRIKTLVNLAGELHLSEGSLDDEIEDCADSEAMLIAEDMQARSLDEQLHFLYMHGFQLGRLEEMIREAAKEQPQ